MPRKDHERLKSYRMSRSTKLRKYASVYNSYVRKTEQSKINKSPRRERKPHKTTRARRESRESREHCKEKPEIKSEKKEVPKSKRKTLNSYQKFVQQESKKDKYKDIPGKQRLSAIAAEWKIIN
jgi:deoxyribodipyrimidine photolyase